jgi:hypothetical protein
MYRAVCAVLKGFKRSASQLTLFQIPEAVVNMEW